MGYIRVLFGTSPFPSSSSSFPGFRSASAKSKKKENDSILLTGQTKTRKHGYYRSQFQISNKKGNNFSQLTLFER
jgi:hypothetical protein